MENQNVIKMYLVVGEASCYHCGPSTTGSHDYDIGSKPMVFASKDDATEEAKRRNKEVAEFYKTDDDLSVWDVIEVEGVGVYTRKDMDDAVSVTLQGGMY